MRYQLDLRGSKKDLRFELVNLCAPQNVRLE